MAVMENWDNIIGMLIIGAIGGFAIWMIPDGGKDVAQVVVGVIGGYITKGAVVAYKSKAKNKEDVAD